MHCVEWKPDGIIQGCFRSGKVSFPPDLLLSNTTANGGDTGAHVWWPAFLRDHILPKWRLTGWAPDWWSRLRRPSVRSARWGQSSCPSHNR